MFSNSGGGPPPCNLSTNPSPEQVAVLELERSRGAHIAFITTLRVLKLVKINSTYQGEGVGYPNPSLRGDIIPLCMARPPAFQTHDGP